MKKFLCTFLALLIIVSALSSPVFADDKSEDISGELVQSVKDLVGEGKAKGAVLSLVHGDEMQLCTGFGFADELNGISSDGDTTAFRIGSISKTFVAAAAQLLAQGGALDMNQDISIYLEPDFPQFLYPITMHNLLTHTAGFEDMITGMVVHNVSETQPLKESIREYIPKQIFKPGEVNSYSNYGIGLAAYVVERISGEDFSQFCQDNIFLPLNMTRTTFEHMHDIVYVSKPYLPNGDETIEPYINLYPEGSAVSTAEDMAKYMMWLMDKDDERILSGEYKDNLFHKQFSMSENLQGIGYVWSRKEQNGNILYDKKGETLHFYSRIALYPERNTGIFLSFNTYLPEDEINNIMHKATDILYGTEPQADTHKKAAAIDISGCYVNNWSGFKTPERILSYIIPGKIMSIDGTPSKGFLLNGKELSLIGEDLYTSHMGTLKFMNKDGRVIMATEAPITFSRIPFWQNKALQSLPVILFTIFTLISTLRELVLLFSKTKKQSGKIFITCSLVQIISFCILLLFIYKGIILFSLLSFELYMKICAILISVSSVAGIVHLIHLKREKAPISAITTVWLLSSVLFLVWMVNMNIL